MNWTLFWQTCRFQRVRLALVCVALAVWEHRPLQLAPGHFDLFPQLVAFAV